MKKHSTHLNANLQVNLDAPTNSAISTTSKISHLLEDFLDEDIAYVPLLEVFTSSARVCYLHERAIAAS